MNKKIRRIFSIVLVACMLLSLVPLHATSLNEEEDSISNELVMDDEDISIYSNAEESNNTESELSSEQEISSSTISTNEVEEIKTYDETENLSSDLEEDIAEQQDILTISDEETEEPENDNWEINIFFLDSSVDYGTTPLTEINWNAESYSEKNRVIKLQINYRNTNVKCDINPGELKISVPMFENGVSAEAINKIVGADRENGDNDFYYEIKDNEYIFYNQNVIYKNDNLEGSIQITYELDVLNLLSPFSKTIKANLNDSIESNTINFNFESSEEKYAINFTPKLPESKYGFPEGDYIWVKYEITANYLYEGVRRVNNKKSDYFIENINDDCIYLDKEKLPLEKTDGMYKISKFNQCYGTEEASFYIYIGYPKDKYKDKQVTENIKFFGNFNNLGRDSSTDYNENEYKLIKEDSVNINVGDFNISYDGSMYSVHQNTYLIALLNSLLINNKNDNGDFYTSATAYYANYTHTIRFGTDLFVDYNLDKGRILEDSEYNINSIYIPQYFSKATNSYIESGKYDAALFVRYENEKGYHKYKDFKLNSENQTIDFKDSEKKVVSYYIEIYNLKEDLIYSNNYGHMIKINVSFHTNKIKESGRIYGSAFLQAFNEDGVFLNEPSKDSYDSWASYFNLHEHDIQTYEHYMQRRCDSIQYTTKLMPLYIEKSFNKSIFDEENECFYTNTELRTVYCGKTYIDDWQKTTISPNDDFDGYRLYDLLPKGMKLSSKEIEISLVNKTIPNEYFSNIKHGNVPFESAEEYLDFIKAHTTINIVENWRNTERTWIEIIVDFSDEKIDNLWIDKENIHYLESFKLPVKIEYEDYLKLEKTYVNIGYIMPLNDNFSYWRFNKDNGVLEYMGTNYNNISDIDNNGSTEDTVYPSITKLTVMDNVSTKQSVVTQVKTDIDDYTTGIAKSSNGTEYEYKLKVRTGNNTISELVIYDSLEKYAQKTNGEIVPAYGTKKHWNGELLGVDTSYAESKGYKVKVYYSQDAKAGNLKDDNSWKEYSEAIDKTKVKSLAFEYLDDDGNPAKLHANSLTYVLIKMKSPSDELISSYAYNGCRTQWKALDSYGNPVYGITGINSNIVKVSLPNSVEDIEVNISFNKIIDATNEDFEKLKLDKGTDYNFFISLTNQETGEVINGLLDSKEGFRVNNIPIGTYIIEEQNDIWFSFVNMILMEPIEGIEFKEENGAYIISISASVESGTTANIEVTNKLNEERFYDNKYDIKNLFTPTM